MENSKDAAGQRVAESHFRVDPHIAHIFRITAGAAEESPEESVKLLEVTPGTAMTGITPVYFDPDPSMGVPYPVTIIEVSPEEFTDLESGKLKLPDGWRLDREYPRPLISTGSAR